MELNQLKVITDNFRIGEKVEGKVLKDFGQVFGRMIDWGDSWKITVYDEQERRIFQTMIGKNNEVNKILENIKDEYGISF